MADGDINPTSRDWKIVENWAIAKLHEHRLRNDSMNLDELATANLRGRISTLKELMALVKKPTPIMEPDHAPGEEQ